MRARVKPSTTWISKSKSEIENEEELLACRRIILKIVRYMKDNKMNQKDLAEKLNVSPQYINKFLHGQDCDIKVSTAIRYGKILGIKLIDIPDEISETQTVSTLIYTFNKIVVDKFSKYDFIYDCVKAQLFKQTYYQR